MLRIVLIVKNPLERLFRKNSRSETVCVKKLDPSIVTEPERQKSWKRWRLAETILKGFRGYTCSLFEAEIRKPDLILKWRKSSQIAEEFDGPTYSKCLLVGFAKSCRKFCLLRLLRLCNIAYWGYVIQLKHHSDNHCCRLHAIDYIYI